MQIAEFMSPGALGMQRKYRAARSRIGIIPRLIARRLLTGGCGQVIDS